MCSNVNIKIVVEIMLYSCISIEMEFEDKREDKWKNMSRSLNWSYL